MENTVRGMLQGYADANHANDPNLLSTYLADECRRIVWPPTFHAAVGAPEDFNPTVKEYEALFNDMDVYHVDKQEVDNDNFIIDVPKRKVAARNEIFVTFKNGEKHVHRLVWFLTLNDQGTKVVHVFQHTDPLESGDWMKKLTKAKEAISA